MIIGYLIGNVLQQEVVKKNVRKSNRRTGRFVGVTGEMSWIDSAGFGEGGGTFNLKN